MLTVLRKCTVTKNLHQNIHWEFATLNMSTLLILWKYRNDELLTFLTSCALYIFTCCRLDCAITGFVISWHLNDQIIWFYKQYIHNTHTYTKILKLAVSLARACIHLGSPLVLTALFSCRMVVPFSILCSSAICSHRTGQE